VREQLPAPEATAEKTGRVWSRSLELPVGRPGSTTEQDALTTLTGALEDVGFDCRAVDDADAMRVEVTHCPFLEVAAEHQDVVCAIHLGLMRGVLERINAPIGVRDLEPLVEPSLCVAHLRR
jgi:predicted ArsR family transcriptional regulator